MTASGISPTRIESADPRVKWVDSVPESAIFLGRPNQAPTPGRRGNHHLPILGRKFQTLEEATPHWNINVVRGPALRRWIGEVAELRITVFREYPYLYDGAAEYEAEYLRTYVQSPDAVLILVRDGDRVVGASTGVPMAHESDAFKQPLEARGMDPDTVFYCGESVLLPAYRGRGIYKRFFHQRERHARRLGGLRLSCFCAVIRPSDHPLKPPAYRPLDPVWQRFGYRRHPDLHCTYRWKDINHPQETDHPMAYWLKPL